MKTLKISILLINMINIMIKFNNFLMTSVPPKPKILQIRYIVNFQKGGTFLYVLFLMNYFNNFNITSYIYSALHGTYGIIWLLKDNIMPDKNWDQKITIPSAIICFMSVLGPYWLISYYTITNYINASNIILASAISCHTFGIVLMMASDSQKFFTLKYKKQLINDGWFKKIRNTNYLGEIMIYFSYALLSRNIKSYFILSYIWILVFIPNMINKDNSIKRKYGGLQYISNSYLLIPFLF